MSKKKARVGNLNTTDKTEEYNKSLAYKSVHELNRKENLDKKYLPKYKIINGPSFSSLILNLQKGQKVIAQFGCMAYMDKNIETKTSSRGGLFSGLKRLIMTSSSMFMTTYIGTEDNENEICFNSQLPSDILPIEIRPGEKIIISPHSLVCFTDNLTINSKRRLRGFLTNEGIYQTELHNKTNKKGILWLSSYGGYKKITLPENKELTVDNGLFLCSHTQTKYDVSIVGGLKTGLLSGEGLVMKFKGPCELYVQGRSIISLLHFIQRHTITAK